MNTTQIIKAIQNQKYSLVEKDFNEWIKKDPEVFLQKIADLMEVTKSEKNQYLNNITSFFRETTGKEIIERSTSLLPQKKRQLTKAAAYTIIKKYTN